MVKIESAFVSFRKAARLLGTSHARLRLARDTGQIHCLFIGRRWVIPKNEILRLLNEQGAEE